MKKGFKLGVMTLAMFGMIAGCFMTTNKAEAVKKITVTLTGGTISDSCDDIADYTFNGTVSLSEQTLAEKSNNLSCTFAKTTQQTVSIQSSALNGPITVPANNVLLTTTSTCSAVTGSVASSTCQAKSSVGLGTAAEVMIKAQNTIGGATQAIKIKVKMPAGAPQGVYSGTLTVTGP